MLFLGLLVWASLKSGGAPGSFGINSKFGEVAIRERPAQDFTLTLLSGQTLGLSELRGKVVVLDFWASWWPPCRQEAPDIASVYREYSGGPVEFIGIDIWDSANDAVAHIKTYNVPYPNGVDQRGTITINYGVRGIPEKFFIDRDGVLVKKFVGPMPAATLRAVLDDLLAKPARPPS